MIDPQVDDGDVGHLPDGSQQWVYPGDGAQSTHIVQMSDGRVQQVEITQ